VDARRALIIEDDPDTAGFFRMVLSLAGFNCESVYTAKDAFDRLATGVPELILLDMRLGLEIGGADILFQIRTNPRFDNSHVIVITAYHNLAEPVSGLADLILMKPVSVDQLKTLAERVGTFEIVPKSSHFRDPVTGLHNQEFFYTRLELAYERGRRREDFLYGVVIIQLHPAGDDQEKIEPEAFVALLKEVAARMKSSLRSVDSISRFSGWRFAALLEDIQEPAALKIVLNRLRANLGQPYRVGEQTYALSVNFGGAVCDVRFKQADEILRAAERALEWALSSSQAGVYIVAAAPEVLS
jgi:diguanylate cyclase (GGDEF)-like protein